MIDLAVFPLMYLQQISFVIFTASLETLESQIAEKTHFKFVLPGQLTASGIRVELPKR